MDPSTFERQLMRVADRISLALAVDEPVIISRGTFRVVDVAGLIRLSSSLELEVCPKFLSRDTQSWREDFFAVATIARFGRVFPLEALRSSILEQGSIADLLGHAVISLYDRNFRRPLRAYRRASWREFALDGEVEPETLLFPDEDGFAQVGIVLDQQNPHNAVIHSAMGRLLNEVRHPDTRRQLNQRYARLSPQHPLRHLPPVKPLPGRHRRWEELYVLSHHILAGFGIGYARSAQETLPGYILKTSDAWEALLFAAVRLGMAERVVTKGGFTLGSRSRTGWADTTITVTPDIAVRRQDGTCFAVDAKYKGRASGTGKELLSIDAADLYEAMAFSKGTGSSVVALVYPLPEGRQAAATGRTTEFERAVIDGCQVVGLTVDVRGIADRLGFRRFHDGLRAGLLDLGA